MTPKTLFQKEFFSFLDFSFYFPRKFLQKLDIPKKIRAQSPLNPQSKQIPSTFSKKKPHKNITEIIFHSKKAHKNQGTQQQGISKLFPFSGKNMHIMEIQIDYDILEISSDFCFFPWFIQTEGIKQTHFSCYILLNHVIFCDKQNNFLFFLYFLGNFYWIFISFLVQNNIILLCDYCSNFFFGSVWHKKTNWKKNWEKNKFWKVTILKWIFTAH